MALVLKEKIAEAEGSADGSTPNQVPSDAVASKSAHARQSTGGEGSSGCEIVARVFPHLTMEELPGFGQGSGLNRFQGLWHDLSLQVIRCRVQLV